MIQSHFPTPQTVDIYKLRSRTDSDSRFHSISVLLAQQQAKALKDIAISFE